MHTIAASPGEETSEQFPEGPHREQAFYTCTACHNFRLVAAQGLTRQRWDETLDWMTERHGMPKLEGPDRARVLDYLERTFPPRVSPGWQNPFLRN